MPKPLKVRRVDAIVGAFVLLALAIVVAMVLLGPYRQRWFMPTQTLDVRLPPEGSLGLRRGSDVQILGSVVGSVDDIVVTDGGEMTARVSVRGNFIRFVRQDSHAVIRKPLGIGDASIEISRGHGEPLAGKDAYIESTADKGPTELMEETLTAIRDEMLPTIREMRVTVTEYRLLATELRGQQDAVRQALGHLNQLGGALESKQGVAGMLLFDPKPRIELQAAMRRLQASMDDLAGAAASARAASGRLPQMSADLEQVIGNLRPASADARRLAARLPGLEASLRESTDLVPGVLLQGEETLHQIERLTEGAQKSWLLRGHMDEPSTRPSRLGSERVGSDR